MQQRIQDLGARVAALKNPQPLAVLENPNFELPPGEQVRGWMVTAGMGSAATVDGEAKHAGAQSLKLTSAGEPISVTSAPFTPPSTGRIAVDLWLRTGPRGLPSVRIALEGQLVDGKYDPYGVIPAAPRGANGEWMRYSFPIDDVPSEGLSNLSVRLDVLGAGEVWIDDVQVFDLPFSESERIELSKLISLASVKLEAGQLADCARLLEGYWPQFLVANVPLTQTPAPLAERQPAATGTTATGPTATNPAAESQKKSGVLDSLRGYLPKFPMR